MYSKLFALSLAVLTTNATAANANESATFNVAGADCMGFVADSLPGVRRGGQIYVDGTIVVIRNGADSPRLDHEVLRRQCRLDAASVQVRIDRGAVAVDAVAVAPAPR
jgi:hypothetical protein